tara:strand:- start:4457 stop:5230 length:774 start_codon:yes stop_codon:yes gene_type:complete
MKFIDTHSHLYSKQFNDDRSQVVKDAINNGIHKILLPNISSKHTKGMNNLCQEFPKNCFPMMGLHPCDVKEKNCAAELKHVQEELKKGKYIAVGEIGIDLYWDKSTLEIQKEAFIAQIKIAKKLQLPIVIHVRDSFKEVIKIVEKLNDTNLRGVFHCFTLGYKEAQRIINLTDFYLGIGGVITFKNSGLDKTIRQINLKNIILETDSPYLAPTPYRGKRNESKNLAIIANKLAEIYECSVEEIAKITTENATSLFKI